MIRIHCNDIGGGFGNKVPVYPGYVCAIAGSIVAGVPVKWIEDRSENLMSTGFARDYIMHAEMCAKDGKITGLRVDVIADHGAFDSTAQPTKFPAGFFHICCGSYDLEAAHVQGQGRLHEQGAGRRRLPVLVPDHRGRLPGRADGRGAGARDGRRPDRPADEQLHQARAVPVRDDHRVDVRLRRLRQDDEGRDGDRRLRRPAPGAGREAGQRRADGDRRLVLHRGRRRRARASTWTSSAWR